MTINRYRLKAEIEATGLKYEFYDAEIHDALAAIVQEHEGLEKINDSILAELATKFPILLEIIPAPENGAQRPQAENLAVGEKSKVANYLREAREFFESLRGLDDLNLRNLLDELEALATNDSDERARAKGEEMDFFAFFNRASAKAKFDYWLIQPSWTVEQAVALSFGKDPREVDDKSLQELVPDYGPTRSWFRRQWEERLLLVEEAVFEEIELSAPIRPNRFIEWCQEKRLPDLPQEFAIEKSDSMRVEELNQKIKVLEDQIKRQKYLATELEAAKRPTIKTLFILSMYAACKHYKYKIDGNSSASKNWSDELFENTTINISVETIKNSINKINSIYWDDKDIVSLRKYFMNTK